MSLSFAAKAAPTLLSYPDGFSSTLQEWLQPRRKMSSFCLTALSHKEQLTRVGAALAANASIPKQQ